MKIFWFRDANADLRVVSADNVGRAEEILKEGMVPILTTPYTLLIEMEIGDQEGLIAWSHNGKMFF